MKALFASPNPDVVVRRKHAEIGTRFLCSTCQWFFQAGQKAPRAGAARTKMAHNVSLCIENCAKALEYSRYQAASMDRESRGVLPVQRLKAREKAPIS